MAKKQSTPRLCSVDGCARPYYAIGYCAMHRQRLLRYGGTADFAQKMTAPRRRDSGQGHIDQFGYIKIEADGKTTAAHVLIAEKALGRLLPKGAIVHHADGNPLNNDPENLVICPDQAYHMLLHKRMRALAACGNANWLVCQICNEHDDPTNLAIWKNGRGVHRKCRREYVNASNARKRLAAKAAKG